MVDAATQDLRWGILGAGGIAAKFVDDITATPGSAPYAVAARDPERARRFAAEHGVAHVHDSYDALVADPAVDVIYVATTHAQHRDHALLAARAGKPVLVEKAFTLNSAEASEVVAALRAAGLFGMEGMWMRMHPLIRTVLEIVRSGELGSVVAVQASLCREFPFDPAHRLYDLSVGGGALLDLGVYPSTFAWLVLGEPESVRAAGSLSPTGTDVTVSQQWAYGTGAVAEVFCSAAMTTPAAGMITGTDGWLAVNGRVHHPTSITVHTRSGERVVQAPPQQGNGFGPEIAEVARCVRAGLAESPLAPLDETVGILRVLDDARRQLGVRYLADETG